MSRGLLCSTHNRQPGIHAIFPLSPESTKKPKNTGARCQARASVKEGQQVAELTRGSQHNFSGSYGKMGRDYFAGTDGEAGQIKLCAPRGSVS
jgi:hypothetical protein